MKITEARLRQILREESARVRLFEAPGEGGDSATTTPPPAAQAAPATASGAPVPQVGGKFMMGNQTARQKYAPHASKFLNPDGSFKAQNEMYKAIGTDLDQWFTTDAGGVTLIESGAYYIGLAGYKKPDVADINAAAGTSYEGELDAVLNTEEEDVVNGQTFAERFNNAYEIGKNDRAATAPKAQEPQAASPAAAKTGAGKIPVVAGVKEIQAAIGMSPQQQDGAWGGTTQGAVVNWVNQNVRSGTVTDKNGASIDPNLIATKWLTVAPTIASVNNTAVNFGPKGTPASFLQFINTVKAGSAPKPPPAISAEISGAPGAPTAAENSWRRGEVINESGKKIRIAWGR